MESFREPVISPMGVGPSSGTFFFPPSGPLRPPKSLSFSAGSPGCGPIFSPTNGVSYPFPPSAGCYRRTASVNRSSFAGGAYRNRSGSVPPPPLPADPGKAGRLPHHFGTGGVRRPCNGSASAKFEGMISGYMSTKASLGGRASTTTTHNGLVWAQLDLLQMDCANNGAENSSQNGSEYSSPAEACVITTEERLIKTNSIWFLGDLQRMGAVHLLQGKDEGSFIVRKSSQSDTLAISVRLPPDKGPYIQHYLVEVLPQKQYCLESSENRFSSLPALLSYYTDYCDELPIQLKLPKCIQEAKTRHELASIALLGQEFWGTTMASPTSPAVTCEEKSVAIKSPTVPTVPGQPNDLSFSSFGKGGANKVTSPLGGHFGGSTTSLTPTRPAPPVPFGLDRSNLNLNLSSNEHPIGLPKPPLAPSFKTNQNGGKPIPPLRSSPPHTQGKPSKPIPPVRSSPSTEPIQSPSNITVTTTLTFNVNPKGFNLPLGGSSPSTPSSYDELPRDAIQLHVSSLEISPCSSGVANSCRESLKLHFRPPYSSPQSQPQTPISEDGSESRIKLRQTKNKRCDNRRLQNKRNSKHYHESNVLIEGPLHCSSLADKVSDYEDLWTSPSNEINGFQEPFVDPGISSSKHRTDISKSLGDLSDIRRESYQNGEVRTSDESLPGGRQPSSPFYVEPLDALSSPYGEEDRRENRPRVRKVSRKLALNRHSDSNIEMRSRRTRNMLARIDDNVLENNSSSQEEMEEETQIRSFIKLNNNLEAKNRRVKPAVQPKRNWRKEHQSSELKKSSYSWVDASWEFLSYICSSSAEDDSALIPGELTVQAMIKQRLPHLVINNHFANNPYHNLPNNILFSNLTKNLSRRSEYDNIGNYARNESHFRGRVESGLSHSVPSSTSDSGTEFSEPWDRLKNDSLNLNSLSKENIEDDSPLQVTGDSACDSNEDSLSMVHTLSLSQKSNMNPHLRSKILSPQMLALRHRKDAESGAAVRKYTLSLGCDSSTIFSQAIRHFLTCTLESSEKGAAVVVRNVRQFMSGMKNYLVTSGEGEFEAIVTRERSNLKSTEFLNLDAILEDVLVQLVLRPLWSHINSLFVENFTNNGSIQKLVDNISLAKSMSPSKLGIRGELNLPKDEALEAIQLLLMKMQHVYAPREKLAHLLGVISHIYHTMYHYCDNESITGDADDLVPMLMWILIHSEMVAAQIEADYIQALSLPSSSIGEASYYLNAFQSAIHSLKHLDGADSPTTSPGNSLSSLNQDINLANHGVLRIIVPDEKNGSILTRTLPIRPGSTARELCRMMAHKLKVTNPQDFALYKLVNGHEWLLSDNECPHKIRQELLSSGSHCLIAFKRIDAKIAWPLNH